jgi:hypothetical protein
VEPSACNASWGACGAPVRSGWPTNAEAGEAEVVSMGDGSVVRARVLGTATGDRGARGRGSGRGECERHIG